MANKIIIKNGAGAPPNDALAVAELGFDKTNDKLYVGKGASAPICVNPISSVNAKTGEVSLTATDVGAVPTTRTVNGKELSSNIILSASDVGATTETQVQSMIDTSLGVIENGSY